MIVNVAELDQSARFIARDVASDGSSQSFRSVSPMSVQGIQENDGLSGHFRLEFRVINIVEQRGAGRLESCEVGGSDCGEGRHGKTQEPIRQSAHKPHSMMDECA